MLLQNNIVILQAKQMGDHLAVGVHSDGNFIILYYIEIIY